MKSTKIVYIFILILIVAFGLFVMYQRLAAQSALNVFLKEARLKEPDIVYSSKEKPFLNSGLILYDVILPQFKIAQKTDKLIIRKNEDDIILQFQGMRINVPQTLRNHYGAKIVQAVQGYQPFTDALRKPFISLGLMGLDTITADIVLIFNPQERNKLIDGKISLRELGDIQISFLIQPQTDEGYRKNLIYSGYGYIPQISVDIQDTGLFKRYARYLRSLGTDESMAYAKELMKHTGFTRRFQFSQPITLAPYYHTQR